MTPSDADEKRPARSPEPAAMKSKRPGPVEVTEGEVILAEGETGKEMYVIETGQVEIYRSSGGVERRLRVLEAGDFFGEMALLDDQPRGASARALTDARLFLIDHSTFDQMIRQHPEVAIRMLRKLCERLRAASLDDEGGAPAKVPEPAAPRIEEPRRGAPAAADETRAPAHAGVPTAPAAGRLRTPPPPGRLVAKPSGTEIELPAKAEITLGRFDSVTATSPDVDLAPFDTQRLTSRRHAKILREEGGLFLFEEMGTANGTFVNGRRIATGVRTRIRDGDELRFGGVTLLLKS
jgi:hypothetical protein